MRITKITYEVREDDLYLYVSGTNELSLNGKFKWILYGEENNVIKSDVVRAIGSSVENLEIIVEDVISEGKKYWLEVTDVE